MTKLQLQGGFDELEFMELFCAEPQIYHPGYCCYEATDELGVTRK